MREMRRWEKRDRAGWSKASVWKALTFAKRSAYRLGNLFFLLFGQ